MPRTTKPRRLHQPAAWLAAQTRADYPHRPDAHPGTVALYRSPAPRPLHRRAARMILRRLS